MYVSENIKIKFIVINLISFTVFVLNSLFVQRYVLKQSIKCNGVIALWSFMIDLANVQVRV